MESKDEEQNTGGDNISTVSLVVQDEMKNRSRQKSAKRKRSHATAKTTNTNSFDDDDVDPQTESESRSEAVSAMSGDETILHLNGRLVLLDFMEALLAASPLICFKNINKSLIHIAFT